MSGQTGTQQIRFLPSLVIGGLSYAAWAEFGGRLMVDGEINVIPALAAAGMAISGTVLLRNGLAFASDLCVYLRARIPAGHKGRAAFVNSLKEIKHGLVPYGWALYWGTFKGKPVLSDIESSAFVVGPSGSGKTSKFILPNILALRGRAKCIYDYKSDLTPQILKPLRRRERLRVINLGGLYESEIGQETDYYSPLIVIFETFFRKNGLEEITDIVREFCFILDPDEVKNTSASDGSFWKNNNRRWIGFVIQIVVITEGERASLGLCLQTLNNRAVLLKLAQWIAGRLEVENVDEFGEITNEIAEFPLHESPWAHLHDPQDVANYGEFLRGLAAGIAD